MSVDRKALLAISFAVVCLGLSGMHYTLSLVTSFPLTGLQFMWTVLLTLTFALCTGSAALFFVKTIRNRNTKVTVTREVRHGAFEED